MTEGTRGIIGMNILTAMEAEENEIMTAENPAQVNLVIHPATWTPGLLEGLLTDAIIINMGTERRIESERGGATENGTTETEVETGGRHLPIRPEDVVPRRGRDQNLP